MNTDLTPFAFDGTTVRVTTDEHGEPWFVAKDVCDYFGVTNRNRVMQHLDPEDKGGTQMSTPGGSQTITTINESGLYTLLFHITPTKARGVSEEDVARKEALVRKFRRWVTHEVLPSIRRRGGYLTPEATEQALTDPDFIIQLATSLKEERARRATLEAQAEQNRPKVIFADAVTASHTTILVGDLAKLLRQNGVEIGANRLFAWMRENGWLIGRKGTDWNMPSQKAMEMGLFEVKETAITHSDGHVTVSRTPKVTGKGQTYFVSRFLGGRAPLAGDGGEAA